jgi:hypothetical protein
VSPWLIVTTGWPAMTSAAGHALVGTWARLLVPAMAALAVTAGTLGSVMWLRRRSRSGAPRRSTS